MIKKILIVLIFLAGGFFSTAEAQMAKGEYAVIIEGYDWGPAVSKVVLSFNDTVTAVNHQDYSVFVERQTDCMVLPADQASGERRVLYAYVSDAEGKVTPQGRHITLVLAVAPNMPLGSPIQYARNESCRGNDWIDYQITVTHNATEQTWNTEVDRIMPLIDQFDLSGQYKHDSVTLTYAAYAPEAEESNEKLPLIIWLHGGGEGGTNPSIPLIANRAANYASDEIQALLGGAYVLVPQTPTRWMDDGKGGSTSGQENDMYNEALMALIQDYVAEHPGIDPDRIYVGGCSNGGYMSLKLILLHPDYFAAGYISALAYQSQYISDEEIQRIKNVPIWFVHAKDDSTTVANNTVVPVYERLKAAGAENVYLSLYDHVVDITGFFGGEDYHYNGHWSWIYCHANECRRDADGSLVMLEGRPVTIMEWMAAQRK